MKEMLRDSKTDTVVKIALGIIAAAAAFIHSTKEVKRSIEEENHFKEMLNRKNNKTS